MSDSSDYLFALKLQQQINDGLDDDEIELIPPTVAKKRSNPRSNLDKEYLNRTQNLVHPEWETLDPTPDIKTLFRAFDGKFFQDRLKCVSLEWSKRMYSCAGICYSRGNRFGMDITIRLSAPLLKLRPRKDLVETLLHEMIHAYCFVLNIREGNGGHGPNFKKIMHHINQVAGTNITVYHNFHDEVEVYKQHWWRCNGICQNRSPFFGYVKRTSNRAPCCNDQWWGLHWSTCGGTFQKIKGPELTERDSKNKGKPAPVTSGDIRKFFSPTSITGSATNAASKSRATKGAPIKGNGGGTLLFNTKTQRPDTKDTTGTSAKPPAPSTSIAVAFPPSSYSGLSTDPSGRKSLAVPYASGGNLRNVMSFGDLRRAETTFSSSSPTAVVWGNAAGTAASGTSSSGSPVDRSLLRDIWSKRFPAGGVGGKSSSNNSHGRNGLDGSFAKKQHSSNDRNDLSPLDNAKRVRVADDMPSCSNGNGKNWVPLDSEVMVLDQSDDVITLSDNEDNTKESVPAIKPKPTSAERHEAIKQEIIDESTNLTDDDIILIDDDFDDEEDRRNIMAAVELADTSIIDEFFGDDELMREFKRENAVRAIGGGILTGKQDIITCPICHEKMLRNVLGEHLDGCMGIAIKVSRPSFAAKIRLVDATTSANSPERQSGSMREILRNAGYTDRDVANVDYSTSSSSEELSPSRIPTPSSHLKTRKLHSCPVCAGDMFEEDINAHLDWCLENQKK